MHILVLGGTGFLGHEIAAQAVAAGHAVTCLARGSAPTPDGVRFVAADRDHDDALALVSAQEWDAVVDVTRSPAHAKQAVRDLRARHWVFVSTANVYAEATANRNEDAPLLAPRDVEEITVAADYGAAKVACENTYRDAGPATIARAGLIGGPGDDSGRSGYWPWRLAHPSGSDVLVPDDLTAPVALIDVRDLAAWLLRAATEGLDGTFNVTGPPTTLGEALQAAALGTSVPLRPVPLERIGELGIHAWAGPRSFPLWIDDPDWQGFSLLDCTRAMDAGLTTRPLADTFTGALAFEESRAGERGAGLSDDDEREIRAALAL